MAYLHKGPKPDGGMFYNVEQAVGATGVNNSGDVKLVQYMIRNLYGPSAAGLTVDGWIGPKTIEWIKKFQLDAKSQGANILTDGRIDRALSEVSSVSKTSYSVIILNNMLRKNNAAAYASLPQAVPLSAFPKANPYNPKAKTVVEVSRKYVAWQEWEVTTVYSDGTKSVSTVKGNITVNGVAYHGKLLQMTHMPATPNLLDPSTGFISGQYFFLYEDCYTEMSPPIYPFRIS